MAGLSAVCFNNNDAVAITLIVIITIVLFIGFLAECRSCVVVIINGVAKDKNVPVAAEGEKTFIADIVSHYGFAAGMDGVAFVDDESHLNELIRFEVGLILEVRLGLARLGEKDCQQKYA